MISDCIELSPAESAYPNTVVASLFSPFKPPRNEETVSAGRNLIHTSDALFRLARASFGIWSTLQMRFPGWLALNDGVSSSRFFHRSPALDTSNPPSASATVATNSRFLS